MSAITAYLTKINDLANKSLYLFVEWLLHFFTIIGVIGVSPENGKWDKKVPVANACYVKNKERR